MWVFIIYITYIVFVYFKRTATIFEVLESDKFIFYTQIIQIWTNREILLGYKESQITELPITECVQKFSFGFKKECWVL